MSQYGGDDYCSVYRSEQRIARKPHTCRACGEIIQMGHRYTYTFSVYDGSPYVHRRCARCQAIFKHLDARIRGEGDYEEFCDEDLNCGHEYKERWGEEPPPEIAALAFALPGEVK